MGRGRACGKGFFALNPGCRGRGTTPRTMSRNASAKFTPLIGQA
jgi:hypothetical protein